MKLISRCYNTTEKTNKRKEMKHDRTEAEMHVYVVYSA